MLSIILGIVLALALVWKVSQLVKAPSDKPLQAVTLCIVCAACSYPLGLAAGARLADSLIGAGTAKLLQNLFLLGTVYFLQCFFLFATSDRVTGRSRARRELIPLGITALVATLAMLATPAGERSHTYATADMQAPPIAIFYVAAGLYLVYSLGMALRWTLRYARMASRPLATGLWLIAAALAAMVLAGSLREVLNVMRWLGSPVPTPVIVGVKLLLDLAIPLFVMGIIYPASVSRWASIRLWWHHRRMYQRLAPLWTALHQAFPEDALNRSAPGGWRERLRMHQVHRCYYRRVIECRDGLVRLSPYIAKAESDAVESSGASAPVGPLTPQVAARRLRVALRAHAAGEPASTQAVPVAMPSGDGLDDDARQLAALSDALQTAAPDRRG
ncbi:MAB_1171c family putative transporter [Streptomyces ehimensis]|uniref:MAB_1171c family putative transporter n=1 Tax=Streptomyces ehimensis TaxID=68195 RepID=A0ABV9BTA8_9ACTN